ncbi:MAG TPA: alanyl-tRNA editing protein [Kofleriaceae bacterium]|jgi:Ser-tRNA(Ala) deacylase AlaX
MTRNVFWLEPYRTEIETRVRDVDGNHITVEDTIFYAFSGGQESDRGSIGGHVVLEARKADPDILYTLAEGHGLSPGDPVTITIDWARRYRLMRLHFAAELVLELVGRRITSIEKIGAHIAQDKARIDFQHDRNIADILPELASEALRIVRADQPIISAFSDEASGQRYWEIAGFSRVPCGGTHLRRTGEVGELELKRKNIGKGKERIEIYLKDGDHGLVTA